MAKRRRSLRDKLAAQKKQDFIGREEQLKVFRNNFDNELYHTTRF